MLIIILLTIVIPLGIILGLSQSLIDRMPQLTNVNGFTSQHKVSLKHKDSGLYVQRPQNINEQLKAGENQEMFFNFYGGPEDTHFILSTDEMVAGQTAALRTYNGKPVIGIDDNLESEQYYTSKRSQIGLDKNREDNTFAIYFKDEKKYLGNPDDDGNIGLSNKQV